MPGEKYETSFKAINFREALKQEKIKIPNKGQVMSQKEADDFVKQENMKIDFYRLQRKMQERKYHLKKVRNKGEYEYE